MRHHWRKYISIKNGSNITFFSYARDFLCREKYDEYLSENLVVLWTTQITYYLGGGIQISGKKLFGTWWHLNIYIYTCTYGGCHLNFKFLEGRPSCLYSCPDCLARYISHSLNSVKCLMNELIEEEEKK